MHFEWPERCSAPVAACAATSPLEGLSSADLVANFRANLWHPHRPETLVIPSFETIFVGENQGEHRIS